MPLGVFGSLLHFAYDWSKHRRHVALFAAVNESYWEQIKIAFWPILLFLAVQFAAGGWRIPGFVPAATIALYSVPVAMVATVFTYKRLTRRNVLWIDILAFFLTIAVSLVTFALIASELLASVWAVVLSGCFLLPLLLAFVNYTFSPPQEPDLFVDPLNARYGLDAHPDN